MLNPEQGYWAKRLSEKQDTVDPVQQADQPLPLGFYFMCGGIAFVVIVTAVLASM